MLKSLIVAMASNSVIGHNGGIPWKIPGEQKMFKDITMGHSLIMGRITHETIGRALPGRTNIVISRQADYKAHDCIVVNDFNSALQACDPDESEAFIIGGGQIFRDTISFADRIYLSVHLFPCVFRVGLRGHKVRLHRHGCAILFLHI